jgi:hypothetical protein
MEEALGGARAKRTAVRHARAPTPYELGWMAVVPCAVLTFVAIVLLGPPLGHAVLAPGGETIFPGVEVRPEPTEHGRYVVALFGPLLFAVALAVGLRRRVELPVATIRPIVQLSRAMAFAFVSVCLLAQYGVLPGSVRLPWSPATRYFTPPTLVIAAAVALLLLGVLRSPAALTRIGRWTQETTGRHLAYGALAALLSIDWLLRAINSDSTAEHGTDLNLIPWEMNEGFAVLNGRTPLVDFHSMYSHLWSDLMGAVLAVAGATTLTWTTSLAVLSCAALLAVFGVFRRVTGSSLLALALYLPFMAISLWVVGSPSTGTSLASVFSIWPLRYSGPYLLAWLTARHVGRAAPRHAWIVFLCAGLVLINNLEFGLGGCAATFAAIALSPHARSRRGRVGIAASAAIGVACAALLVAMFTLIRAGRLPDFRLVLEFPQVFGRDGWGLEPMPTIGLHIAMYLTFVAAIAVAVVRTAQRAAEPVLTSMLAWAGTFGLLAASYYVGRSDPGNLIPLFSTWSFALALLLVAVVRQLLADPRRPTAPDLLVIVGFALALASVLDTPTPWSQIARLGNPGSAAIFEQRGPTRFAAEYTRPGERVAILAPLGFRIAHDNRLVDLSPYSSLESIRTSVQLQNLIAAIQRLHIHRIFIKTRLQGEENGNLPPIRRALTAIGFKTVDREYLLAVLTDR